MSVAVDTGHELKRELRLRDLVPMQILLVMGVTWAGYAARQGGTHMALWLASILLFFLPSAAVVTFCARLWPEEGGVYQWTKYVFGPFAGFMSAWNFAIWALLMSSSLGIQTATSLAYGLGPRAGWMSESHSLILSLTFFIFVAILLVNIPGFSIGRWVAHFGTSVMVLVMLLMIALLVYHPHTSLAHPHHSPQPPFQFALPAFTLLTLNLFSKIAFNSFTGLEQVAVFAGETRDPARAILRSAWIAAPAIALLYILSTGSILTYIPANQVDLTGPIPQLLAAAFGGGAGSSLDIGLLLGRGAILLLAVANVAQFAVILAETSRLPMVAGWDRLLPAWFTRLHPRWETPVRSITVMVSLALCAGLLANALSAKQEAYQLLVQAANFGYGAYYLLMLAIPLAAGARLGKPAGLWTKIASSCGFAVTLLAMGFGLVPIVTVTSKWGFAAEVFGAAVVMNLCGAAVYWRGSSRS
jgi:amino acid transporter